MAKHHVIGILLGVVLFIFLLQFVPKAKCMDGWGSPSIGRRGACSHHGGVRDEPWGWIMIGISVVGGMVSSNYFKPKFSVESFQLEQKVPTEPRDLIKFAIERGKRIEFVYKKLTENSSQSRTILPSRLNRRGNTYYVAGYCELRKGQRTFAIGRMSHIRVL